MELHQKWLNGCLPELKWHTHDSHRDSSSVCTVKKNGFDHTGEDLGHVNAHDLRDHLREVDLHLQSLRLYEQIVGELV